MSETLLIMIRQRVNKRLTELGAISKENARTLEEIKLPAKWLQMPGIKKTEDGKYYLSKRRS